jgi:hypothetical protein
MLKSPRTPKAWIRLETGIAVARRLSVLMHRLLCTGEVYEPLRNSGVAAA